ncbi:hypothetical protein [Halolamina salifodinae]|uniref:Uncharacterized protein n=1 Tax=Halolamina salifodinae TaxID=1202767 RepID=A0A8T4GVX6_9EURY|nr:hypothetical protein [Halolamina salifodinae]MBP1987271.1 hypothetical protein [Halolamina salifodinae]
MSRHTTDDRENRRETSQRTMGGVNHTNPMTGETFGDSQVFERGKVAVVDGGTSDRHPSADGGEAGEAANGADEDDHDDEPMGEIDHTPREDAPSAEAVYTRGEEDPAVESADVEEEDEGAV